MQAACHASQSESWKPETEPHQHEIKVSLKKKQAKSSFLHLVSSPTLFLHLHFCVYPAQNEQI